MCLRLHVEVWLIDLFVIILFSLVFEVTELYDDSFFVFQRMVARNHLLFLIDLKFEIGNFLSIILKFI